MEYQKQLHGVRWSPKSWWGYPPTKQALSSEADPYWLHLPRFTQHLYT